MDNQEFDRTSEVTERSWLETAFSSDHEPYTATVTVEGGGFLGLDTYYTSSGSSASEAVSNAHELADHGTGSLFESFWGGVSD
ncbi:MAG: hypothetical protein ACRCXZ_10125 [Patescibacteria group bacterium]